MNQHPSPGQKFLLAALVLCLSSAAFADAATSRAPTTEKSTTVVLPPLQAGVTEIRFREFYDLPIGPRGLKPTQKLLALDGKRVRILGFMAKQEEPSARVLILCPVPVSMSEAADGPADDLPAAVVFVHLQTNQAVPVPYTPGPLLLTGTLDVGPMEEADGRVSAVRLLLDEPAGRLQATAKR